MNAPCFSFRCRSPGTRVARHFFTLHSYLLLLLGSPGGISPSVSLRLTAPSSEGAGDKASIESRCGLVILPPSVWPNGQPPHLDLRAVASRRLVSKRRCGGSPPGGRFQRKGRCAAQLKKTYAPPPRSPGGWIQGGAAAPGLGRFKGKEFLREGGNRNPPSLKRVFGYFLHEQKATRGPGPGRPRRWQVCTNLRPGPAGPDKQRHCGGRPLSRLRRQLPLWGSQ